MRELACAEGHAGPAWRSTYASVAHISAATPAGVTAYRSGSVDRDAGSSRIGESAARRADGTDRALAAWVSPPLTAFYFVFDADAALPGVVVVVAPDAASAEAAARRHVAHRLPEYRDRTLTLRELAPLAADGGTVVYVDEGGP